MTLLTLKQLYYSPASIAMRATWNSLRYCRQNLTLKLCGVIRISRYIGLERNEFLLYLSKHWSTYAFVLTTGWFTVLLHKKLYTATDIHTVRTYESLQRKQNSVLLTHVIFLRLTYFSYHRYRPLSCNSISSVQYLHIQSSSLQILLCSEVVSPFFNISSIISFSLDSKSNKCSSCTPGAISLMTVASCRT